MIKVQLKSTTKEEIFDWWYKVFTKNLELRFTIKVIDEILII